MSSELEKLTGFREIWKDIPGWEGIYKVSNTGLVASLDRQINGRAINGRILKQRSAKSATKKVNLCTGTRSESITYTVGYLVLLAFIGPPKGMNTRAKHKDGVPTNNNLENLYWGPHGPNRKIGQCLLESAEIGAKQKGFTNG